MRVTAQNAWGDPGGRAALLVTATAALLACAGESTTPATVAATAGGDIATDTLLTDSADTGSTDVVQPDALDVSAAADGRANPDSADIQQVDAHDDDAQPADVQPADSSPNIDAQPADAAPQSDTQQPWVQQPVWDMALIKDAKTAACTFSNKSTALKNAVLLDTWSVTYKSWESIDGVLKPILIRGFAARPQGITAKAAGIVQAHGLGGFAKLAHATGPAALTGAFVIAYTGPGGGDAADNTSEGRASGYDNGKRMFDVIPDTRGTWFWGHTVAAMRAVTCLSNRPDVDPQRIGMTGYSAGGVATWLAAAHDDRIKAAVPLSGVLAWDEAVKSPDAWQHALLTKAGETTSGARWKKLMSALIEPSAALAASKASLFLVNGTTDEFFPLTANSATFAGWQGEKRMALVANYDHGCYAVSGVESAKTIGERAVLRAEGAQRALFHHVLGDKTGSKGAYTYLPQPPKVTVTALPPAGTFITAVIDGGGSELTAEWARIWWSNDNALVFGDVQLDCKGATCTKTALYPTTASTVWYVDVQYKTSGLFPERFSVSSEPHIPAGHVPKIRSITSCFPNGYP